VVKNRRGCGLDWRAYGGNVVLCRVVHVWVDDNVINERKHLDPAKLDLVGRMGGLSYCYTRERFELKMGKG
jgi:flavin reductase (DIM6/NTAB) family NADH-FMN oxidoreductase RutF